MLWKLQLVARLRSFSGCLSEDEKASIYRVVQGSVEHGNSDPPIANSGNDSPQRAAQDTHLERYKRWKLGDAKIEELTSVRPDSADSEGASALDHAEIHATDLAFFARGKRGVLFAGSLRKNGARVVVKLAGDPSVSTSSTVAACWVETEARWIRIMNRIGVGAALEAYGTGWLICERLNGYNIVEFLSNHATTASSRWVLREMLCQCFAMDMMGINKEEMTHPTRHIIVHAGPDKGDCTERRWKCTFIDFEKCSYSSKPKNVTQLCQFITSPRMTALFLKHCVVWDVQQVRQHTKQYKMSVGSKSFDGLLAVFKL